MIGALISLMILGYINFVLFCIGTFCMYYFGYVKWYKDYRKIKEPYKEMGREWGPKPLLLIYSFNLLMSAGFIFFLLGGVK